MADQQGTPILETYDISLDGKAYFALQQGEGDARQWAEATIPEQEIDAVKEVTVKMENFRQGAGFTWGDVMPGVYEVADGWDASPPDGIVTWGRHATGATQTTVSAKGWYQFHDDYLWMLRHKYVVKYQPDDTHGGTWAQRNTAHDLTTELAAAVVSGRPAKFRGSGVAATKMYIPVTVNGVADRFIELTTVATGSSADTYTLGPAATEAQCFTVWKEKLVLAEANTVRTCSADPMTAGNWSAAVTVGSADFSITAMTTYGPYLICARPDGLYTLDEDLRPVNEVPDVAAVIDLFNGYGIDYVDGSIMMPHKLGLMRWQQGSYDFLSVAKEGGLDGTLSAGWGRIVAVAPYGGHDIFWVSSDYLNSRGYVGVFHPGDKRTPYTPHIHHVLASGTFEDCVVLSLTASAQAALVPITWSSDNAVGTIAWSSPSSGSTEDGAVASAAFAGASAISEYLKGLNPANGTSWVPTDATVTGIKLRVKKKLAP